MSARLWLIALVFLPCNIFCQGSLPIRQGDDETPWESQCQDGKKQTIPSLENVLLTECEKKAPSIDFYPNFSDNPLISKRMQRMMAPYLLPLNHPLKPVLDKIFARSRAIETEKSLKRAGFSILFSQKKSFIIVAKHPNVRGYLFKIYLDSKNIHKDGMTGWELLRTRCLVAQKIKKIIRDKKLKHFIVADKWLYPLPVHSKHGNSKKEPVILMVKDMQIYSRHLSTEAWRKKSTKRLLRELYAVLGRGYGSAFLSGNIPYSKSGKFAFIDTEYNKRKIPIDRLKRYFARKLQPYWDHISKGIPIVHGVYLSASRNSIRGFYPAAKREQTEETSCG